MYICRRLLCMTYINIHENVSHDEVQHYEKQLRQNTIYRYRSIPQTLDELTIAQTLTSLQKKKYCLFLSLLNLLKWKRCVSSKLRVC